MKKKQKKEREPSLHEKAQNINTMVQAGIDTYREGVDQKYEEIINSKDKNGSND